MDEDLESFQDRAMENPEQTYNQIPLEELEQDRELDSEELKEVEVEKEKDYLHVVVTIDSEFTNKAALTLQTNIKCSHPTFGLTQVPGKKYYCDKSNL
jgi:hypothetical protein